MHRSEVAESARCAVCGTAVWIGRGRGYAFGPDRFLCWDCSLKRGGSYDERRDEWTQAPDLSDLAVTLNGEQPQG